MSVKQRIFESVALGILLFLFLCIIHKFMNDTDWLYSSLEWSVAWASGNFVAKSFSMLNKGKGKTIFFNICAIFVTFIVLAVIIGIMLNVTNWSGVVLYMTISFAISLFYSTFVARCIN